MNTKEEDFQRVYFKGESMWVKVKSRVDEKHLTGILDNYPVNSAQHRYQYGDTVKAYLKDYGEFKSWEPVEAVKPLEETPN